MTTRRQSEREQVPNRTPTDLEARAMRTLLRLASRGKLRIPPNLNRDGTLEGPPYTNMKRRLRRALVANRAR
jgi:hypothetical protein